MLYKVYSDIIRKELTCITKHGKETAKIKIIDELLFNLDKNQVSGMVLVDYCKAFDMVDHKLLLEKLKVYGVKNNSIDWFKSYLVNRHQFVSISGKTSGMALMKHGVPHDSILGLLLFIVFINDLPLHVSSSIDLYDDDTAVTVSVEYDLIPYVQVSLSKSVNEIAQWKLLTNSL